ncbi:MAG: hypothetical protein AB7F23_02300 [Phycisphaerae bacterium]|jgi:hypothetical protein
MSFAGMASPALVSETQRRRASAPKLKVKPVAFCRRYAPLHLRCRIACAMALFAVWFHRHWLAFAQSFFRFARTMAMPADSSLRIVSTCAVIYFAGKSLPLRKNQKSKDSNFQLNTFYAVKYVHYCLMYLHKYRFGVCYIMRDFTGFTHRVKLEVLQIKGEL